MLGGGRVVVSQVRCSSGRLKELGVRLRSIKNIEKITKTMKMISSAKFAKVYLIKSNLIWYINNYFSRQSWSGQLELSASELNRLKP